MRSHKTRFYSALLALLGLITAQWVFASHACTAQLRASIPAPSCHETEEASLIAQTICKTHCQSEQQTLDRADPPKLDESTALILLSVPAQPIVISSVYYVPVFSPLSSPPPTSILAFSSRLRL